MYGDKRKYMFLASKTTARVLNFAVQFGRIGRPARRGLVCRKWQQNKREWLIWGRRCKHRRRIHQGTTFLYFSACLTSSPQHQFRMYLRDSPEIASWLPSGGKKNPHEIPRITKHIRVCFISFAIALVGRWKFEISEIV